MDWSSVGIPIFGALFSGAATYYGLRNHWLNTERSDVRWSAKGSENHPGKFAIVNFGNDSAYKVEVEACTEHEWSDRVVVKKVGPNEWVPVVLEKREQSGPAPVAVPPNPFPKLGETPPSQTAEGFPEVFEDLNAGLDTQWRRVKDCHQAAEAQRDQMRKDLRSQQVEVHIIWRTRHGRWASDTIVTG